MKRAQDIQPSLIYIYMVAGELLHQTLQISLVQHCMFLNRKREATPIFSLQNPSKKQG